MTSSGEAHPRLLRFAALSGGGLVAHARRVIRGSWQSRLYYRAGADAEFQEIGSYPDHLSVDTFVVHESTIFANLVEITFSETVGKTPTNSWDCHSVWRIEPRAGTSTKLFDNERLSTWWNGPEKIGVMQIVGASNAQADCIVALDTEADPHIEEVLTRYSLCRIHFDEKLVVEEYRQHPLAFNLPPYKFD